MGRRQAQHGCNCDGAARSHLGDVVWALDVGEIRNMKERLTETEEIDAAMRRAGMVGDKKSDADGGRS